MLLYSPKRLVQYIGQEKAKKKIELAIKGALLSNRVPPHMLFVGKPGTGKTTLAKVIAEELDAEFKTIMGPSLKTKDDLIQVLLSFEHTEDGGLLLDKNQILFIDEIHSMPLEVEEQMYTILEDWTVDFQVGNEIKKCRTPLIMVIGATTRLGDVRKPLRERFDLVIELEDYTPVEIAVMTIMAADQLGFNLSSEASIEIMKRSRLTPRIAYNLLYRCIDMAIIKDTNYITPDIVLETMEVMGLDEYGLEARDYYYLLQLALAERPVGSRSLAQMLGVTVSTIEEVIEPWLVLLGFVRKTSKGREITPKGIEILNKYLEKQQQQDEAMEEGIT
ncbi:AAA family ATPase [Neomoorella thermoacetica]|uniref:AAA family ATPase n=1 Tax=Neomoorella thermoacetica TaxID=1525 RepID=UPI0008FB8E22|nr:AAA family ATPase [Moorella thermoacetica]APC07633.1 holliday junction ATP-dependent DNA helicase RuvB [Moorella thermoacetica]OIQ53663.1 holliday junction ATP-dependent DNA helicase RuvB [Moorella thermoacetica]